MANMIEEKISITALENKIVVSPDRPSLNAPKILVPLAQKVAATNK